MHDSYIKDFFANIVPSRKDAFGRAICARVIGWKRTSTGQLGAICVFPHLGGKYLYTVDAQNRMRSRFLYKL